jgi:glycosyltransferase involved in cell wall biosynthesis
MQPKESTPADVIDRVRGSSENRAPSPPAVPPEDTQPGASRYLILVAAGAKRLSSNTFAVESAFALHLRELRAGLAPRFREIVVAMSELPAADWPLVQHSCSVIDEVAEGIRCVTLYGQGAAKLTFLARAFGIWSRIRQLVHECDFVHSHLSHDLWRPIGAMACAAAVRLGKPCLSVTDIDNRRDAEMNYRSGRWPLRVYLTNRYLYDPIRNWLQRAYVRRLDLVLFKEMAQVEDFGRGAGHVRFFLDPQFAEKDVLDDVRLAARVSALAEPGRPLRVIYFGRLVGYKGVECMLQAVAAARSSGAALTFTIMGDGEDRQRLERRVVDLAIGDIVSFVPPRPYGDSFFEVVRSHDLLLACPLSADTPRSTWDALASGTPVLAFDTPFYRSLAQISGALITTAWPQIEPMAAELVRLAADKQQLANAMRAGVATARANTSAVWLARRIQWVEELVAKKSAAPAP